MYPVLFAMGREPQEKWHIDIVIGLLHIGVGVVQYVVLDPPDVRVRPYKVHGKAQAPVHGLFFRIGAVYGIVHDAHPYPGHPQPAYYIEHEYHPYMYDNSGAHDRKGPQEQEEHKASLPVHARVGVPVGTAVPEM